MKKWAARELDGSSGTGWGSAGGPVDNYMGVREKWPENWEAYLDPEGLISHFEGVDIFLTSSTSTTSPTG